MKKSDAGQCTWTESDDGVWETDCGSTFEITNGTPAENRMSFCPYCGKSLFAICNEGRTE